MGLALVRTVKGKKNVPEGVNGSVGLFTEAGGSVINISETLVPGLVPGT